MQKCNHNAWVIAIMPCFFTVIASVARTDEKSQKSLKLKNGMFPYN